MMQYSVDTSCKIRADGDSKAMIEHGADVNAKDNYGYTVLILAARNGHTEIVELLIERGADIEAMNNDGNTALIQAARYGILKR